MDVIWITVPGGHLLTFLRSAAQSAFPPPKKRIPTPHWTLEEAMTQKRVTRRAAGGGGDDAFTQQTQTTTKTAPKRNDRDGQTLSTLPAKADVGKDVFTSASSPAQPQRPVKGVSTRRRVVQD